MYFSRSHDPHNWFASLSLVASDAQSKMVAQKHEILLWIQLLVICYVFLSVFSDTVFVSVSNHFSSFQYDSSVLEKSCKCYSFYIWTLRASFSTSEMSTIVTCVCPVPPSVHEVMFWCRVHWPLWRYPRTWKASKYLKRLSNVCIFFCRELPL